MNVKMQGVLTALITPFNENDEVCQNTLTKLLERQMHSGIDCVVVLGTTAEAPTLDDKERDLIISTAVKVLKGHVPVMVGCGSPSTHKTIEMCHRAQELGADTLQIVAPYYNKPSQEGLFLHYQAISEAVKLPICLYNHPGRCGVNIDIGTAVRLAELPNIISIKECLLNFQQITDIVEKICHKRSNFTLISGDDPLTLPMMAVGAHGIMSVLSNLVPKAMKRYTHAILEGNFAMARAMHYALKSLMEAISIESNPAAIKYLMRLAHLDSGHLRLPLTPVSRQGQEKIKQIFESCRELLDEELHPENLEVMT